MGQTKSISELVRKWIAPDPAFGAALLREGIDTLLSAYVDAGKAILRGYVKATVGFKKLGEATAIGGCMQTPAGQAVLLVLPTDMAEGGSRNGRY